MIRIELEDADDITELFDMMTRLLVEMELIQEVEK
jgi:hypothetical protein